MSEDDDLDRLLDRDRLLSRRGARRGGNLLYLLESWSGGSEEAIVDFLAATDVFRPLGRAALADLLPRLEPVHVAAGDPVAVPEGAERSLFVVVHGRVRVEVPSASGETSAELGPGQVVGEEALLDEVPAEAVVRAVRDSLLLRLSAAAARDLAAEHPELFLRLATGLARRLAARASAPARAASRPRTLALVALDAGDLADVAGGLGQALSALGPVTMVGPEDIDRALGPGASAVTLDDPRNGAVVGWLQRVEQDHQVVVYQAGEGLPGWTSRCLRQADRILVVANGSRRPDPYRADELLSVDGRRTAARTELVLVHPANAARPRPARPWLQDGSFSAHHHLRRGRSADIERLARRITGRAVGLVLGGGGPRGFAHLGVLRALEERGVPVDMVGGTSVGAVIGSLYALGWDHDLLVKRCVRGFIETRNLFGYTLPLVSLATSGNITKLLSSDDYLADQQLEDLWVPFFCVSANLSTSKPVVHDEGLAWRAVRASLSLPCILPPVYDDGDLLVDGGLVNNLPADVMHERIEGGPIVAVDLEPESEFRAAAPFEPTLSGWKALAQRLRGRGHQPAPDIVSVLMRLRELANARVRQEVLASGVIALHLRPPVERTSLTNFSQGLDTMEIGYRDALDQLDQAAVDALIA